VPRDPLAPDEGRELFMKMMQLCEGRDREAVLNSSINVIANYIRRYVGLRTEAERMMNDLYGANMQMLMEHYDPVTNKRRSVVPFTQTISMETVRKGGNGHT
jgi:hypothetical protein